MGVENGGFNVVAMLRRDRRVRACLCLAWADGLVAAVVLVYFILREGRRLSIFGVWMPIAGTCVVGVSLGLPLFLLMREKKLRRLKARG